jgi:pyridoxamine 5'-phosphate oxidase
MSDRKTEPIDLAAIRVDYRRSELRHRELEDEPLDQFALWLHQAIDAKLPEPTAMILATVGADGRPSQRTVLLKGFDAEGLRFFTNYGSQKGRELEANPNVAACFFWPELQRQVRVGGRAQKVSRETSADYFASRPYDSQIGAWASPQSQPMRNREELESRWREAAERFKGREVELPEHWGGFRIAPESWEFWQGRPNRMHDRFRYRRAAGGGWLIDRLAP